MPSYARTVMALAMLGLVNAQGVIIAAKGDSGTSKGLAVDPNDPTDANFISQEELVANIVNECGRTFLTGNIDIGEQTEIALTAKEVTQVKKSSSVAVTISQRDANGAGPFTCDLDLTSNANGATGQVPLKVTQDNKATPGNGDTTIQVALPNDMACIGASTGNVCTVRCKNAQNFGGCFAVQQTDVTPRENTPDNIVTAQTLKGVLDQVAQDIKDLPVAIKANQDAVTVEEQGPKIADALIKNNPQVATPVATPSATPTAGAGNGNGGNGNGNGRNGRNRGGNNNAGANTGANTGNGRNRGGNAANRNGANQAANRGGNNNQRRAFVA